MNTHITAPPSSNPIEVAGRKKQKRTDLQEDWQWKRSHQRTKEHDFFLENGQQMGWK